MKFRRPLFALISLPWLLAGAAPSTPPETVVATYNAASQEQNARLRGASMEVDIEARLPKLKKRGRLHALRHISRLGRITYDALRFEGDSTIKNNVIARYLSAEVQAQTGNGASLAITPANYKFKYKGLKDDQGRPVHVFQLTPRKKQVGLFKGEVWLDAATCMPVRESGRLVKNPSIFVKRIEFVRVYDIRDGVAIPRRIESVVDTRLVGIAELTIDFRNVSLAESSAASDTADASE
jgi:hypothetical protein